jgi:Alkylmercury lyase
LGDAPVSTAETIWERFQEVGFVPDLTRDEARLLIDLYRQLAASGRPIPRDEVAALAAHAGVEADASEELIRRMSERDETGDIRGIMGLSLNRHPHRFRVHGNELATWCALDPLVIAPIMTDLVEIESNDPTNGETVHISVDPSGSLSCDPKDAVVSIVIPESGAPDSVERVWKMFCHQVFFFTDRDSANRYFSESDKELYYLPVEEAFELGRFLFAPVHTQV